MCRPHFRSVKITEDMRKYATKQGIAEKEALKKAFTQGSLEEIPARFYQQREIAKKTIFITDQKI